MSRRVTWPLVLAVVFLAVFVVALSTVQIDRGATPDVVANQSALWVYWVAYVCLWGSLTWIAWRLVRDLSRSVHTERGYVSAAIVLVVAAVARIAVVVSTSPQLSDDIWRYIHDGRTLAAGGNPYAKTPAELGAGNDRDVILDRINHPDLVTIYLPTSQWVYAAAWLVRPASWDPLGDRTFRAVFLLFDLLNVALLLWILRGMGRSSWWVALYAWHPLTISEVAGSGHQDVVGMALLLGAATVAMRSNIKLGGSAVAGLLLGLSAMVKPFVLPLALVFGWRARSRHRLVAMAACSCLAVIAGVTLPFIFWGDGIGRLFETGRAFVGTWAFNSPVYGPLVYLTESRSIVGIGVVATLAGILVIGAIRKRGGTGYSVAKVWFLAILLLSSTVYPWYLLWALVFVPIRFDWVLWVFSLTISLSYVVLADTARWHLPTWVVLVEYIPIAVLIAVYIWLAVRSDTVDRLAPA